MKWKIITDTSCNLEKNSIKSENITFEKVPFKISFGEKSYTDDENIDIPGLLVSMENSRNGGKTGCPSIGEWSTHFKDADSIIVITISSSLSGSFNSAMTARNIEIAKNPTKQILVIDSKSAGPALDLLVLKAEELIDKKFTFAKVNDVLQKYARDIHTTFALKSFRNLVANGRVSRFSAFLAGRLSIWGVGEATEEGRIGNVKKMRGTTKVIRSFIQELENSNFNSGPVIINHCENKDLAMKVKNEILSIWYDSCVEVIPMCGLCTFYAERGGLMVAF